MNTLFADWHAEVSISLPGDVLSAREKAADAIVASITRSQVLDLATVAFQCADAAERTTWFRDAIKAEDNTFRMRGNDRETAVLAGACLWDILDGDGGCAVLAAYACALAGFRGWTSLIPDLTDYAEHRLLVLGTERRILVASPESTRPLFWTKQLSAAIAGDLPAETPTTGAAVQAAFNKLGSGLQATLDKFAGELERFTAWAENAVDVCAEEGSQVGWLLSGASIELGRRWGELDKRTAAVLAARELAAQCSLLPAPPQADAFLDQLLDATAFAATAENVAVDRLQAPEPLGFLLESLPNDDSPARQARHSLRQALLVRAWEDAE